MELVTPTQVPVRATPAHLVDPRERIVRTHARTVWRYLRALGCPDDEADDLVQEVFVVALGRGFRDRSESQINAFLRRTARHLYLRSREKEGRRAKLLMNAAELLWSRDCAHDHGTGLLDTLRDCVDKLRGRSRRVVDLVYGEDMSRAEVARELRMRENGVKTLLQRVRRALRDCMDRNK